MIELVFYHKILSKKHWTKYDHSSSQKKAICRQKNHGEQHIIHLQDDQKLRHTRCTLWMYLKDIRSDKVKCDLDTARETHLALRATKTATQKNEQTNEKKKCERMEEKAKG